MDKAANGKWEMALQPPTMEELQKTVGNVFDVKWIKYIYAHFKNVIHHLSISKLIKSKHCNK